MRYTSTAAVTALTASAGVLAQSIPTSLPTSLSGSGLNISSSCQSAAFSLISSPLVQCLQISALFPLFTSPNGSIIPVLDNWMEAVCSSAPCNQTAFNAAASALSTGCESDLKQLGFNASTANETLTQVFQAYPIVRELVCLKTTDSNSTVSNITNVEASQYQLNTTNGTFCVSNLLEQVEEVAGFNLTVNKLIDVGMQVYGGNYSSVSNFTNLPPTALCQDCIFAGADIIAQSYPQVWNITVGNNGTTVAGFLNDTCEAEGYNVTYDGTLPNTIFPSAIDSDYPFALSTNNYTYTPGPDAVPPPSLFNSSASRSSVLGSATASIAQIASSASRVAPVVASATSAAAKRDVTAAKKRWFGA